MNLPWPSLLPTFANVVLMEWVRAVSKSCGPKTSPP